MEQVKIIKLHEVDSTNAYLQNYTPQEGENMTVVTAEFQTAGKGQGHNTWESNEGENLLFSVLTHPKNVPANKQFVLSMAIAMAIKDALRIHLGDNIEIKWPNDIYWHNHKLGGILIQCSLSGAMVKDCIMGVGLDVNQRSFENLTKNPISIFQITGREVDRDELLQSILEELDHYMHLIEDNRWDEIQVAYRHSLYRRHGYFPYFDKNGDFMARFVSIDPAGRLTLKDDDGMLRTYAFKEVKFLIEGKNVDCDEVRDYTNYYNE